tara:strand:+ start:3039 stop:3329 length:291 start_codon:yes stop_codon:yes gene_type:complete
MNSLEKLRDKIQGLEKIHQLHILKIFMDRECNYTENANGIFINMGILKSDIIKSVQDYLDYVVLQENHLGIIEFEKNKYKDELEKDNKEKNQYIHN